MHVYLFVFPTLVSKPSSCKGSLYKTNQSPYYTYGKLWLKGKFIDNWVYQDLSGAFYSCKIPK